MKITKGPNITKSEQDAQWREDKQRANAQRAERYIKEGLDFDEQHEQEKRKRAQEWQRQYRKVTREKMRLYVRRRMQTDPLFKLAYTIRNLTRGAFKRKGRRKTSKTLRILGCSVDELQVHLIQSALRTYGFYIHGDLYHIDHIVPLASAKTEAELISLGHYNNLQYLTPEDNLKKSDLQPLT